MTINKLQNLNMKLLGSAVSKICVFLSITVFSISQEDIAFNYFYNTILTIDEATRLRNHATSMQKDMQVVISLIV